VLAEAEAEKAARVGIGEAIAIEEQVRSYGGPKFQVAQQVMVKFAEAIEKSRVDVVPKIVVGGGGASAGGNGIAGATGGSSLVEALLAILLSDKLGEASRSADQGKSPEIEKTRAGLRGSLEASLRGGGNGKTV
jgi:hypothetical protein